METRFPAIHAKEGDENFSSPSFQPRYQHLLLATPHEPR